MKRFCMLLVAVVVTSAMAVAAEKKPAGFGQMILDFSKIRHKHMNKLSKDLELPVPPEATAFMKAAEGGDWKAVSNLFQTIRFGGEAGQRIASLHNELWAPIHETVGAYEEWAEWQNNAELMAMFYEPVLASMPTGAIYFGGTDYGRFLVTTA